jgi:hypothetical protein
MDERTSFLWLLHTCAPLKSSAAPAKCVCVCVYVKLIRPTLLYVYFILSTLSTHPCFVLSFIALC